MKRLAIIIFIFTFALFMSPRLFAQMPTWDLARNLQISFTQGANGVWFFMESTSWVHDPSIYRLLPRYLNPCLGPNEVFKGVGCWRSETAVRGVKTEIAFNFTNKLVGFCRPCEESGGGGEVGYFPHSVRLSPLWERFAIVAWRSPITGIVNVAGRVTRNQHSLVALGADWFVDKGDQTLQSGHVFDYPDGQPIDVSNVAVVKGDVLYFIARTGADVENPVQLRVTITQVQ